MPHTQYVKAAMFSSRMPPAAAQANKIGINKIDRCVVMQGKDKVTPKQESKHTIGKFNPRTEQSPVSDSERESAMPSGKSLSMFEMMNAAPNSHASVQSTDMSAQSKMLVRKSGKSPRTPRNHTSCLDVPQNANVLNTQERVDVECNVNMLSPNVLNDGTTCNIKVEHGIEESFSKQESVQYFNDSASDSSIVSSRIEMHNNRCLKRICSDKDLLTMHNKKRPNDGVYASTNANNEEQRISYLKCKSFAAAYPTFSDRFNQYSDVNSLTMAESPNSNLREGGTEGDYIEQLINPNASLTNEKEQLISELHDTLLTQELAANPGKL